MIKKLKFKEIKYPSNKKFGFFFSMFFFMTGAYFFVNKIHLPAYIFLCFSFFFILAAFIKPIILQPVNKYWMKFGLMLGIMFNPIFLGILYFGVFTPISIITRLFNRDELKIKFKKNVTYWLIREDITNKNNSFFNQF